MKTAWILIPLVFVSQDAPGLDRSVSRGREVVHHNVPGGRPDEICVLPRHLHDGDYRGARGADDEAAEAALCRYDFYRPGPTRESSGVATCPHAVSTAGSIEFMDIPIGRTRKELQTAETCGIDRPTQKLARFKTSDYDATTTVAPGGMLAYHVSRMLGDILNVPPAVLRTVDVEVMRDVAERAPAVASNELVKKSFANYLVAIKDPPVWKTSDIFTTDYTQLYGFLSGKVSGDSVYPGWVAEITTGQFEKERGVRDAFSESSAANLFGKSMTAASLQRAQSARDFADLIVFDEILSQGDRFTGLNLAGVPYYYHRTTGGLEYVAKRKVEDGSEKMPAGAMLVVRLVVTDNDCTLTCPNVNAEHGYSARLRHLHPRTYAGIQHLAKAWKADPSMREQLARDIALTPAMGAVFEKNLTAVAETLREACVAGRLKLDLDPDALFLGTPPNSKCDGM